VSDGRVDKALTLFGGAMIGLVAGLWLAHEDPELKRVELEQLEAFDEAFIASLNDMETPRDMVCDQIIDAVEGLLNDEHYIDGDAFDSGLPQLP
jgi:hypothetical protein